MDGKHAQNVLDFSRVDRPERLDPNELAYYRECQKLDERIAQDEHIRRGQAEQYGYGRVVDCLDLSNLPNSLHFSVDNHAYFCETRINPLDRTGPWVRYGHEWFNIGPLAPPSGPGVDPSTWSEADWGWYAKHGEPRRR